MMWTQDEISSALGNSAGVFLAPGIMGAIAAIFKVSGWLAIDLILLRYFVYCLLLHAYFFHFRLEVVTFYNQS